MSDPINLGQPLVVNRSRCGAIGLQSDTAVCTWDGLTLHVLEVLYSFSADFHFNPGFVEARHVAWPFADIVTACESYFYPSGLPGVCGFDPFVYIFEEGTAFVYVITYGLPSDGIQLFDLPQVSPSNRFDQIPPDPSL